MLEWIFTTRIDMWIFRAFAQDKPVGMLWCSKRTKKRHRILCVRALEKAFGVLLSSARRNLRCSSGAVTPPELICQVSCHQKLLVICLVIGIQSALEFYLEELTLFFRRSHTA
ncbi:hypothetical protein M8C21_000346 [Ambrosia artemisiifolia]|uniref:Uncharacterized protein n=1 Tax=Ambrosia artemisiifolia TaxID=4212 RepID=A0AAD5CVD5_AMBAR|nr:hypothetical protein M8C21_000346 [Ambrosia artemisiifolia]